MKITVRVKINSEPTYKHFHFILVVYNKCFNSASFTICYHLIDYDKSFNGTANISQYHSIRIQQLKQDNVQANLESVMPCVSNM